MLTFFTYLLAFIFTLIVINLLHKVMNNLEIIHRNQHEHKRQLDDRITDLRDHVRRTETAIFRAIDEKAHHLSDPVIKSKIGTIEEEIKDIASCLKKMTLLLDKPKPKPKKAKQ